MKNKTIIKNKKVIGRQSDRGSSRRISLIDIKSEITPVYTKLVEEGHEDFYNYLDWLGLAKSHDLLILASAHHYYFEADDLKNINTVVNLRKLNNIERIRDFLLAIYDVMPVNCHFISSFTDSKKQNGFLSSFKSLNQTGKEDSVYKIETGSWNSLLKMIYELFKSKTNRSLSEKTIRFMLEETGLKILDLTEFNGQTYFCAKKINPSV